MFFAGAKALHPKKSTTPSLSPLRGDKRGESTIFHFSIFNFPFSIKAQPHG
jgi:hypothetical protein